VTLELRQALEPWHVLGEEGSAGGTVRYVDRRSNGFRSRRKAFVEGRHIVSLQRPPPADDLDRSLGRGRGRRPLQGLAAGLRPAPDHPRPRAPDL
jgi:hypothetical protein